MAGTHAGPNYMTIFWWLFALTIIEVGVIFTPFAKIVIAILLISLAISKASLVAMYFMHLRFERRTLGLIAVTPLLLGTLLVFILVPDHSAVPHRTSDAVKVAPVAGHR
ncbi:MAG: cytochrome C oxidase subunit IV family protein [Candidatus Rokubacteria bacterium]|nr:cytochrome C oxidase subunit IV family protein [Candidatus Rokubacteria bacterium]